MNYDNLKPFTRDTPVGTRLVAIRDYFWPHFNGRTIRQGAEFTLESIEPDCYWLQHECWGRDWFSFGTEIVNLFDGLAILPDQEQVKAVSFQETKESSPHYHIAYINSALKSFIDYPNLHPEIREDCVRRALEHGKLLEKFLYEKI